MTPVRVTFSLRTPVVIPYTDKHLDALLSWAAVQKAEFEGHDDPWTLQHDIGVEKHECSQAWCFKAGLLTFDWVGERNQLHYIKRSKLEDYADAHMDGLLDRRPAFDAGRGSTKAGSYFAPTRWVKSVTGFAVVRDMHRFEELLPWVTHIGKLRHKDYGAVSSFSVDIDPAAMHLWSQRNLPPDSDQATRHVPAAGALASPYWKRENHREVLAFAE